MRSQFRTAPVLALVAAAFASNLALAAVSMNERHREFLSAYCTECHNEKKQKGKLRLDDISFTLGSVENADRWQKILNQINSGEMPPEDGKQPERVAKTEFLDSLSQTLVAARLALSDSGGKITLRRLNRREYRNTIRDLLGVEMSARELPADGVAGNFDTVGSSLFMSSDQFEQYLALGRQALDEHLARFTPAAVASAGKPFQLRKDPEQWANQQIPLAIQKYREPHDRYLQWTAAVDEAAGKPDNAEVARKWREHPQEKGDPSLFYNHWEEFRAAPSPTKFGFANTADAQFACALYRQHYQCHVDYLKLPQRDTGAYLMLESDFSQYGVAAEGNWPPGSYLLRVRLAATEEAPPERRFVQLVQGSLNEQVVLSSHQVTGTLTNPQVLEVPIEIMTPGKREFILRDKHPDDRDAKSKLVYAGLNERGAGPRPCIWIDWMEIEGPINAAPRSVPHSTKTIKERREVELHANAMVGGTYKGYFKGGYEAAKAFLETGMPQKGIPDELEAKFRIRVFEEHGPTFERYLNDPLTRTGAYLTTYNVHTEEIITLPPDQPSGWLKTKHEVAKTEPGEYVLRFRIGAVEGTPKERHFVALGSRMAGAEEFTLMGTFQIHGTTDAPQLIEVPVNISANGPRSFVLREKRDVKLDAELYQVARKQTKLGPPPALWIDWVEWEGPLRESDKQSTTEPVLTVNTTNAAEHDYARTTIERFAVRAFRGARPTEEYLSKLVGLCDTRRRAGDPFEVAIREPLSVVLASPGFLYLAEPGEEKRPRALNPFELAARLSYFLWSSPPDASLLGRAQTGDLLTEKVLTGEVERLIADEKADEFVSGFVHQWLGMERLDFFQFDTKQFRDFDESAKAAARREVYETFAHLLRHNGSLSKLLKSDEVHVNSLLAQYYGLEGVNGDAFRKVKLPPDSPRGGLLGMAAILAMGSNGERTSPVERGVWVLRKLLHAPPPPAPPNIPQITRLENKLLNTSERLLAHQEEPQCMQCHRKIDPIGLGLENFDAAGKWRTEETYEKRGVGKKTWPIAPGGVLHNGPAFADYFQLRDIIASKPDAFARCFAEALIEYALGRPYGFTDSALAEEMVTRAQARDFELREFIIALVKSPAFGRK